MASLKFSGTTTLEDVYTNHRELIYDKLVETILLNYQDTSLSEVRVIDIAINDTDYSINLARSKFISGLTNALSFYESTEQYEKCKVCLDLINTINKKN
jgi:hypothetical protein